MKAIVQRGYGSLEKLELADVPVPTIGDDGVLVRVRAASVNSLDWRLIMTPPLVTDPLFRLLLKGRPTPKGSVPGSDHAGIVEAVGKNVTRFAPGDEVIGFRRGSFAQFVAGKETNFAPKPKGVMFEEAAALPHAGLVALQGIRDHGRVKSGQRVLINGASGGVGHLALQYAKSAGAYVTAVCGAKAVDMVRSLGADQVVDRGQTDFTETTERYDLVFDVAADRPFGRLERLLAPGGRLVLCGAPTHWLALLITVIRRRLSPARRAAGYTARHSNDDLRTLSLLVESGQLRPVIDRTFPLAEAAAAVRYVFERRARGKVVVTVWTPSSVAGRAKENERE